MKMGLIAKPEVNRLKAYPNAAGSRVWIRETRNSGMRYADEAELLNAVYASGYVPRTQRATYMPPRAASAHSRYIIHTFRIGKL